MRPAGSPPRHECGDTSGEQTAQRWPSPGHDRRGPRRRGRASGTHPRTAHTGVRSRHPEPATTVTNRAANEQKPHAAIGPGWRDGASLRPAGRRRCSSKPGVIRPRELAADASGPNAASPTGPPGPRPFRGRDLADPLVEMAEHLLREVVGAPRGGERPRRAPV